MIVRCNKCNKIIDLKNAAAILFFVQNGAIKCPNCSNEIYYKGDK